MGPEGGAGGSRDGPLGRGRRAGVGPDRGGWVRGRGDRKWGVSLERGVASMKGRGQIVDVGPEDGPGRWGGGGAAGVEP